MQDEVNEKVISLCIKGGKISATILKDSIKKLLAQIEKQRNKLQNKQKAQEKQAPQKEKSKVTDRGKQSLKKLMDQGGQLTNIKITDNNVKSFDRVARKYGIDYSLKKDNSVTPPHYLVFFKAKDVDVMTAAFKEYAGVSMKKTKKASIRKKLEIAKQRVAKHRERSKTQQKDRGQAL
ncbi:MAG: PcfB family protein [Clostridia bacterium]|nr:PcfB family protein [Clostridia bacterium]